MTRESDKLFGKTGYVMTSHRLLDTFIFPAPDNGALILSIVKPYNFQELLKKAGELLGTTLTWGEHVPRLMHQTRRTAVALLGLFQKIYFLLQLFILEFFAFRVELHCLHKLFFADVAVVNAALTTCPTLEATM